MQEAASMMANRAESADAIPAALLRRFAGALRSWRARRRQMREIARLDDHMLADIGLTAIACIPIRTTSREPAPIRAGPHAVLARELGGEVAVWGSGQHERANHAC